MLNPLVSKILSWYGQNARDLPWRHTLDPYKIWLSEIILQQTRVAQGLPYYNKFVYNYPNVASFADAREDEILHLWQGLGYYSRARNMHSCAKTICAEHNGKFPTTYSELKKLKGIGDYTAAAIASFAFNEKKPAIDGNIIRIISRIYGIFHTPYTKISREMIEAISMELIEHAPPASYNQAMMEFGALQCVPKNPDCNQCPVADFCYALEHDAVGKLPAPKKKIEVKNRFFYFMVIHINGNTYIEKRTTKDIWRNLFQFPLIEAPKSITEEELQEKISHYFNSNKFVVNKISPIFIHKLTHRTIYAQFVDIILSEPLSLPNLMAIKEEKLSQYAFPKLIHRYLNL